MVSEANSRKNLSNEQKIGFVLLLIFGLITLSLGFLQMRNTIYGPFVFKLGSNYTPPISAEDKLKALDTDHDGLSDYDELYIYSTSPYLEDTDSDNILDKTEIERGTDPLCAEGQTCGLNTEYAGASSTDDLILSPLGTEASPGNFFEQLGLAGGQDVSFLNMGSVLQDPQKLRELLIKNGTDPVALSKVSDQDLLQMVQKEVYGNAGAVTQASLGGTSAAGISDLSQMGDLLTNPSRLRQLLLTTGKISQAQLDKISDEQLLKMATDAWGLSGSGTATTTSTNSILR